MLFKSMLVKDRFRLKQNSESFLFQYNFNKKSNSELVQIVDSSFQNKINPLRNYSCTLLEISMQVVH